MTRREFLLAMGAGTSLPFAARAQPPGKLWRIGYLTSIPPAVYEPRLDAFKAGMTALGYADGRDYLIETRASGIDPARLAAMAAELVALKADLIFTAGTQTILAASRATRTIPIVMTTAVDPVGNGVAASLARPGGNVTGLATRSNELSSKLLDLLRQMVPGLLVAANSTNATAYRQIISLAGKQRLPAIYSGGGAFTSNAGALMYYGPDNAGLYRQAAAYADRIFKGARPADLPIQQPARLEFQVNLKTAKALGLKVPHSILIQAAKVIE